MHRKNMRPKVIRYLTTNWRLAGLAILCGLVMAMGQAPLSFPFGFLLALPGLGWLFLNHQSRKGAFLTGWWAGCGYFAASVFWIVEPFFVEPEIYGWMAPFALIFMAAGLALFWGWGFLLASYAQAKPVFRLIALAVAWTGFEFARAHILTGFPWGLLAYVWSETPIFQLLAFIGPHGLGLITLLIGFLPLVASRNFWISGSYSIILIAALWFGGQARIPDTPEMGKTTVRLLQPNAPQHLKWRGDMVKVYFTRLLEMTRAPAPRRPDVVIWPETSIAYPLEEESLALQLVSQAAGPDTQVIAGIQRRQDNHVYNSMVYLDQTGGILAVYDKHHLVPFGEYVPLGSLLSRFGISEMVETNGFGFAAGSGIRIINASGIPDFLPLICYEAIFPGLSQLGNARPKWIVHITNDAWFGNFSGPYQHLVQVRARAIEQGLPVARSANTGVSTMIDPYGQILAQLPLNEAGFLDAQLPKALSATLYVKWGEIIWILIAFFLTIIVSLECRKSLLNDADTI